MNSNDVASDVDQDDKYRYFDDIEILELVMLSDVLVEYDFKSHVASDIGTEQKFLPTEKFKMQNYLNNIKNWTDTNQMKLNLGKSNFTIFTRAQTDFMTRLRLDISNIEQLKAIKLLGIWISEDLTWNLNCQSMVKEAYSR